MDRIYIFPVINNNKQTQSDNSLEILPFYTELSQYDEMAKSYITINNFLGSIQNFTAKELIIVRNYITSLQGKFEFDENDPRFQKLCDNLAPYRVKEIINRWRIAKVARGPYDVSYNKPNTFNPRIFHSVPVQSITKLKYWKYEVDEAHMIEMLLFYQNFTKLYEIDQWTLIMDNAAEKLSHKGYNIELFASPINARLRYHGSINAIDEPFGRIGTYVEIMREIINKREIRWRDEIVNNGTDPVRILAVPPANLYILYDFAELLHEAIQSRDMELIVAIPRSFESKFAEKCPIINNFMHTRQFINSAWSHAKNSKMKMNKFPWVSYHIVAMRQN